MGLVEKTGHHLPVNGLATFIQADGLETRDWWWLIWALWAYEFTSAYTWWHEIQGSTAFYKGTLQIAELNCLKFVELKITKYDLNVCVLIVKSLIHRSYWDNVYIFSSLTPGLGLNKLSLWRVCLCNTNSPYFPSLLIILCIQTSHCI